MATEISVDERPQSPTIPIEPGAPQAVIECLEAWTAAPQELGLPSAPSAPLRVHRAPDRPQARRDVEEDGGMSVHVGRVRRCPVLGIKLSLLGHNTERGAAGGSILNAELARAHGHLGGGGARPG